jgi:hypothetical protein
MKNHVVGSKILKKEQVLISIFLIALLVLSSGSMVAYAKSNTIVVTPTKVDDTANIQAALNSCASPNPPCTVQLVVGTYIISSQIAVTGFQGRLVGMGQGQTTIEAKGGMPSPTVTPYWAQLPGPSDPWPVLFTFVGGSFTMSGMTITDTSPTPTMGWSEPPENGGGSFAALTSAVEVTGLKAYASFDHITVVGAAGDYYGYNIGEAIHVEGTLLPSGWSDPNADTEVLTGAFSITNSVFTDTTGAEVNMLLNSNVVICGNTISSPDVNSFFDGMDLIDISNTNVLVCGNHVSPLGGTAVRALQSIYKAGLLSSTITITDNNFLVNEGANGANLQDADMGFRGTPSTLNAVVSGNDIQSSGAFGPQWGVSAIATIDLKSILVSLNTISGGGNPGIYILGGPGTVIGNTITGADTGVWVDDASGVHVAGNLIKNSVDYGIAVTSVNNAGAPSWVVTPSSNNFIVGNFVHGTVGGTASTGYDLYWDQATGSVNNHWCGNFYHTSNPSVLPGC